MSKGRLAVIPARGGSKGIPRKNLAIVGGISLTARAILFAQHSGLFDVIHVSTDDDEIAKEAERYGAPVSFLRSSETSSDVSSATDVIREVHRNFANRGNLFATIAVLEPTSPMRTKEVVEKTLSSIEGTEWDAALTLSPVSVKYHPDKQFTMSENGDAQFFTQLGHQVNRRQDLSVTYVRNGLCYAIRSESIEKGTNIFGYRLRAIVWDIPYVNIDTPEDLERCRKMLRS